MRKNVKLLTVVAFVVCAGAIIAGAYHQYGDLKAHAVAARSHLRAAEPLLRNVARGKESNSIRRARDELAAARADFAYVVGRLDSFGPLYGLAERIPWVGAQAIAARKLMRAGGYVSQAGVEACFAAEGVADKRNEAKSSIEVLMEAIPAATGHLSAALKAVDQAQAEYAGLSTEGLHPLLAEALNELSTQAPKLEGLLNTASNIFRVLPEILGQDGERVYLLLIQDADELRPTGGFLGNYGIIRLHEGRIVEVFFNDAYRIDWPYYYSGKAPPLPDMFARYLPEATFWALRDSNIWPDFERSAKQAIWFALAEGVAERIDGVIAVTDEVVQPLMRVTGPITIPEYGETVDQANVLQRIRFHQSVGPSQELRARLGEQVAKNRKLFTSLVLSSVIERINNLDMYGIINLGIALQDSFKSRGLQVYFSQPELQKLVETYDLGGQVKTSAGDYLWVVDTNLSASKDNAYVRPSISYSVFISDTSGAISELDIVYDYSKERGERYTGTVNRLYYGDYLRVYVPSGSKLLAATGTDEPVETLFDRGKTVFGTFLKIYPGNVKTVKLRYWHPLDLQMGHSGADPPDGSASRARDDVSQAAVIRADYELLVQKQAGNNVESLEVTVALPDDARVVDRGVFESSGGVLKYHGPLHQDVLLRARFLLR